jgi:hypothetical protein
MLSVTAALVAVLFPALALADIYCPTQISIYGTVQNVNPHEFTLHTESHMGDVHVSFDPSQVHSHGLTLRPGVFAGVYGCLNQDRRSFNGMEVTLANSPNDYDPSARHTVSFDGRITSVASGRALLQSDDGRGNVWVYTNTPLRPGQHVHVTGSFDPLNSAFVATSVVPQ